MVQLWHHDALSRHAQITAFLSPEAEGRGWPLEGVLLFIDYAFAAFDLRKIYVEALEPELASYRSLVGTLLREEAGCATTSTCSGGTSTATCSPCTATTSPPSSRASWERARPGRRRPVQPTRQPGGSVMKLKTAGRATAAVAAFGTALGRSPRPCRPRPRRAGPPRPVPSPGWCGR
jgi:hypothetical protein